MTRLKFFFVTFYAIMALSKAGRKYVNPLLFLSLFVLYNLLRPYRAGQAPSEANDEKGEELSTPVLYFSYVT